LAIDYLLNDSKNEKEIFECKLYRPNLYVLEIIIKNSNKIYKKKLIKAKNNEEETKMTYINKLLSYLKFLK